MVIVPPRLGLCPGLPLGMGGEAVFAVFAEDAGGVVVALDDCGSSAEAIGGGELGGEGGGEGIGSATTGGLTAASTSGVTMSTVGGSFFVQPSATSETEMAETSAVA